MAIQEFLQYFILDDRELVLLTGLLALQWVVTKNHIRKHRGLQEKHAQDLSRVKSESQQLIDQKNRFIRNLSQELKVPLGQAVEALEAFAAAPVPDWQRNHIAKLSLAAHSLARLVEGLGDYSAILDDSFQLSALPFNARKKLEQVEAELQEKFHEKVMFVIGGAFSSVPEGRVRSDPVRLGKLLRTLVEVCTAFSEPGSVILAEGRHRLSEDAKKIVLEFRFRAEGLRIPAAEAARLSEALLQSTLADSFRFGDPVFELFVCHQLALRMGGGIKIGTVTRDSIELGLRVGLPLAPATAASATAEKLLPAA